MSSRRTQIQIPKKCSEFFGNLVVRSFCNKGWLFRITQATARNSVNTLKLEVPEIEKMIEPVLIFRKSSQWIWYVAMDGMLNPRLKNWMMAGISDGSTKTTKPSNIDCCTWYRTCNTRLSSVFGNLEEIDFAEIPIRTSAKSGVYLPKKGRTKECKHGWVRWRSLLELAAYVKMDMDNDVWAYYCESEKFTYQRPDTKTFHTYILDVYKLSSKGMPQLIEIKPESQITNEIVLAKAKAVTDSSSIDFQFWTEKTIFGEQNTSGNYWQFREFVANRKKLMFEDFCSLPEAFFAPTEFIGHLSPASFS